MMADRIFLRLGDHWALGYDDLQWIVMQYRPPRWRPVSYVTTKKVVLMRVLEEKGVVVTPDALTTLNRLPETFREWYRRHKGRVDSVPEKVAG